MKQYKFTMPIEVRTSGVLTKTPEYVVRGFASTPDVPDTYKIIKGLDGKTKGLKSVFTKNAIESMNKQGKSKKIFVDAEHRTAIAFNVDNILKQKGVDEETRKYILQQVEIGDLPLSKLKEFYIDEPTGKLVADTRLNPSYKLQGENHASYFDAVWESLNNKNLDGMSINFSATKFLEEDGLLKIDDVDLYGISYTGGAATPENSIFEVAMRATMEYRETIQTGEKMEQEMAKLQEERAKLDKERQVIEQEKSKLQQEVLDREKAEQKKINEDLKKELEELKKSKQIQTPAQTQILDKYGKPETPTEELLKTRDNVKDFLQKKVRTTNRYPYKQDLFRKAPMSTNPDGEWGLGELLYIDGQIKSGNPQVFDMILDGQDSKKAAFSGNNMIVHRRDNVPL